MAISRRILPRPVPVLPTEGVGQHSASCLVKKRGESDSKRMRELFRRHLITAPCASCALCLLRFRLRLRTDYAVPDNGDRCDKNDRLARRSSLRAIMWDSRENSSKFSKTGRTRWSYETYSFDCANQAQCRDTFARMRPSITVQEDDASALQQRVNVQQRTSYRQQRSSWQQDSRSWYTMHVNFLLRPSLSCFSLLAIFDILLQRLLCFFMNNATIYSFLYAYVIRFHVLRTCSLK